jgi:biopolymer transport protein ExbB
MFMNADVVVKAVMVGLVFASVVTWTVCLAKTIELLKARRRVRSALSALKIASNPCECQSLEHHSQPQLLCGRDCRNSVVRWGRRQRWFKGTHYVSSGADGSCFQSSNQPRHRSSCNHRRDRPFVGLFGTVWGIMNSFIGISKSHTTNLAVVAPGIAEAARDCP